MGYFEVYKKRLNRYGLDYQSRIQGQRERNFENYLLKSVYRVDFWYNDTLIPAVLEKYKQDHTGTQGYLLTTNDIQLNNGSIIKIENGDGEQTAWMIWWKEQMEDSGYNRYVTLKMSHLISWLSDDGHNYEQWAYFYGPGTAKISDTNKSPITEALYKEDNNLYMLITPYNGALSRNTYLEFKYGDNIEGFSVTENDIFSTPGIMYVSMDPTYIHNDVTKIDGQEAANFWINGGF